MVRSVTGAVFVLVLALYTIPARGDDAEVISTHCRESEVRLDSGHTASLLDRCGEEYPDNTLWDLDRIDQIDGGLDGHFDRHNRGTGSVVYVMDTGVMADHVEFESGAASRVIAGFDTSAAVPVGASRCRSTNKALAPCFADFDELPAASHGTAVASIVAGNRIGVAPGALIVSIRVMNERGLATTRSYLDGLNAIIRHAWSAGAPHFQTAVVNISAWVLEEIPEARARAPRVPFAALEQKIRDMVGGVDAAGNPDPAGKKFLFVVAANNVDGGCGRTGLVDRFPAVLGPKIDGVITVGGMTPDNAWWYGSCRGSVEVLAPAQSIFSASITARDHYRGRHPNLRSGTSFAAPIVSGVAARLLADNPALSPRDIEAAIRSTPSRIYNPAPPFGDGKVACVPPPQAPMISSAAFDSEK